MVCSLPAIASNAPSKNVVVTGNVTDTGPETPPDESGRAEDETTGGDGDGQANPVA